MRVVVKNRHHSVTSIHAKLWFQTLHGHCLEPTLKLFKRPYLSLALQDWKVIVHASFQLNNFARTSHNIPYFFQTLIITMGFGNYLKRIWKDTTIEPVILLMGLAFSVLSGAQVQTNLLMWKICHIGPKLVLIFN